MRIREVIIILVFLSVFNNVYSYEKLYISTGPKDSVVTQISEPIIIEAYRRLGIDIEVISSSWSRSLILSNEGERDGELCRTKAITRGFKDLLIVDVPLLYLDMVAITNKKGLKIESWEDLKPYRVSYLRGIKAIEMNIGGLNVFPVNTVDRAFELLRMDRVDIVVAEYFTSVSTTRRRKQIDLIFFDKPLISIPVFHFLHSSHAELKPKLENTLREMKLEGYLKSIRDKIAYKDID